jgi:hypothetical protein
MLHSHVTNAIRNSNADNFSVDHTLHHRKTGRDQYHRETLQATEGSVTTKADVYGCYLIDASYSMEGEPMRTAMHYVHQISTEILDKNNRISVYTFNDRMQRLRDWHDVPVSVAT